MMNWYKYTSTWYYSFDSDSNPHTNGWTSILYSLNPLSSRENISIVIWIDIEYELKKNLVMVNINRNIMQLRIIEWCVVDACIRFSTVKRRISNVHVFVLKIYLFVNCVIRNVVTVQNQLLQCFKNNQSNMMLSQVF